MSQDFERRLAEALAGLDQGKDIEDVLAEFPEEAAELTPLLEAATYARETLDFFEPRSAAGLTAGRRRMLEAAARKRATSTQSGWHSALAALRQVISVGQWFRTPARGLATAALLLALFFVVAGGATVAAADSLPGDPLYSVKRVSERVRLTLTTDPAARAALQARFNRERQVEARTVAAMDRHAQLRFEGVLDQRTDGAWIVDGIQLIVDPGAVEGAPAVGSTIVVDVVSPGDGTLHMEHMALHGGPHGPPGPTMMPGGAGPMHGPGRPAPMATSTAGGRLRATRVPPTRHPMETHEPAMPAQPTYGGPMMGQPTASTEPMGPGMGQPTATPVPTQVSPTQPAPIQVPPTEPAPTDTPAPSPTHHGPMMPHPTNTPGGGHHGGPGGPGMP